MAQEISRDPGVFIDEVMASDFSDERVFDSINMSQWTGVYKPVMEDAILQAIDTLLKPVEGPFRTRVARAMGLGIMDVLHKVEGSPLCKTSEEKSMTDYINDARLARRITHHHIESVVFSINSGSDTIVGRQSVSIPNKEPDTMSVVLADPSSSSSSLPVIYVWVEEQDGQHVLKTKNNTSCVLDCYFASLPSNDLPLVTRGVVLNVGEDVSVPEINTDADVYCTFMGENKIE